MSNDEFLTIQGPNAETATLLFPGQFWVKNKLLRLRLVKWVAPDTFRITTVQGLELLNQIMKTSPNPRERELHGATSSLSETLGTASALSRKGLQGGGR